MLGTDPGESVRWICDPMAANELVEMFLSKDEDEHLYLPYWSNLDLGHEVSPLPGCLTQLSQFGPHSWLPVRQPQSLIL